MRKISKINWNRYKESNAGKDSISMFSRIFTSYCTMDEILDVAKRFNPEFFKNTNSKDDELMANILSYYNDFIFDNLKDRSYPETIDDFVEFYHRISKLLVTDNEELAYEDIPQSNFKNILSDNIFISLILSAYIPTFFLPNLLVMQFAYFKRFAEKYELDMPEIPNRANYKDRWEYYLRICLLIDDFAIYNEIFDTSEICAFIFDYEFPLIREEMENESASEIPLNPGQAWILVGNFHGSEKSMEYGFWQANQLTEKGDLLLFYEKSPVKALNSIWIAQQGGIIDPFFRYYSNTYIGNKISIPKEMVIRFEDFKNSEYFKLRDKKGNFVSKNFQDVSGWAVTYDDYNEILRMLKDKGFDTTILPKLYMPTKIGDILIETEQDVSDKLVVPLLEQMGWEKDIDFKGEVEFNAGRTKTNHSSDKRPDFCLHIIERNDDIEAKVVIEVKKYMKNQKEIHEAFVQGRSYAKWGAVKVLVIVDMRQILVYQIDANNKFNENKPLKFNWSDMENPDKFADLKRILS